MLNSQRRQKKAFLGFLFFFGVCFFFLGLFLVREGSFFFFFFNCLVQKTRKKKKKRNCSLHLGEAVWMCLASVYTRHQRLGVRGCVGRASEVGEAAKGGCQREIPFAAAAPCLDTPPPHPAFGN